MQKEVPGVHKQALALAQRSSRASRKKRSRLQKETLAQEREVNEVRVEHAIEIRRILGGVRAPAQRRGAHHRRRHRVARVELLEDLLVVLRAERARAPDEGKAAALAEPRQ